MSHARHNPDEPPSCDEWGVAPAFTVSDGWPRKVKRSGLRVAIEEATMISPTNECLVTQIGWTDSRVPEPPPLIEQSTRAQLPADGVAAGGAPAAGTSETPTPPLPDDLEDRISAVSYWNRLPSLWVSQTIVPSAFAYELARELAAARAELERIKESLVRIHPVMLDKWWAARIRDILDGKDLRKIEDWPK